MRTIKFRAKTLANGHWVYGNLVIRSGKYASIHNSKSEPWVDPNTVGQLTGLKDENGKEIYEGDIISGCFKYDACDANGGVIPDQDCRCKGVVRFSELRLQWVLDIFWSEYPVRRWIEEEGDSEIPLVHFEYESPQFNMDLLEVIGNIFDSPDL